MKSLRFRVLALIAGFGVVTAALLAGILYSSVRSYYVDITYDKAIRFAERVLENHPDLWETFEQNPPGFGARLREFNLYSPNIGLYLVDNDGRVLASAGEGRPFWSNYRVDLQPLRSAFAAGSDEPVEGDDPDGEGKRCLVAARPVSSDGQQVGWLYVVPMSGEGKGYVPDLMRSYAMRTGITVSLMTIALGVLLTITMIAVLTRPLIGLTRMVERVRASGFTEEVCSASVPNCDRFDEIGRLGRTFRDTFERLRLEMHRVKETDAKRREMVASVSHDLRTPLTALIGQLETIRMKAGALSHDEQQELFARAMNNAQHLKRLTDSLAELARLDSPDFEHHPEPIAIGELADDVVQRFTARASEAGLSLELVYPDGLPLTRVDAGLIERALANLLDNALRMTPAGGRVVVRVERDADGGVRLEVTDTGPGVPVEDQPRVFERFFQASRHREQRGSAGLGLAIVKRVAELHGGRVGLKSQPGSGATFYIDLPQGA
jgi:signal transduction histidine kinase